MTLIATVEGAAGMMQKEEAWCRDILELGHADQHWTMRVSDHPKGRADSPEWPLMRKPR